MMTSITAPPQSGMKPVTVIGAGTMGHGIALVFALGGYPVTLVDNRGPQLEQAMALIHSHIEALGLAADPGRSPQEVLENIHPVLDSLDSVQTSRFVIEAIAENRQAKAQLFAQIAKLTGPDTIVASNTSYLNAIELVPSRLQKKFLIAHFFNPPYIIPLVELVGGDQLDPATVNDFKQALLELGMVGVVLKKFVPGFIVNRMQRAIGREVFFLLEEGVADADQIDKAVKASLGIRIPVLGVVARYDYAGLDMVRDGLKEAPLKLAAQDTVPALLDELVQQGHLGVKTGRGFFNYADRQLQSIVTDRDLKLM
jgi:3-hydroxybutyryl-CoA dehydrogenase